MKVGLLTEEEIEDKVYVLGGYVRTLGKDIYQLPGGGLTNKAGWDLFEKELKNRGFEKINLANSK